MKYYGVRTKFYNNGKVKAEVFEVNAEQKPQADYTETNVCDIYQDYFDTKNEADEFARMALMA